MGIFSDLFSSVLGGISASSQAKSAERQTKEATKEAGRQNRATAEFEAKLNDYYTQKYRHEKARALDSNYRQISTVQDYLPGFKPGTGLDPLAGPPKLKDYEK